MNSYLSASKQMQKKFNMASEAFVIYKSILNFAEETTNISAATSKMKFRLNNQ